MAKCGQQYKDHRDNRFKRKMTSKTAAKSIGTKHPGPRKFSAFPEDFSIKVFSHKEMIVLQFLRQKENF